VGPAPGTFYFLSRPVSAVYACKDRKELGKYIGVRDIAFQWASEFSESCLAEHSERSKIQLWKKNSNGDKSLSISNIRNNVSTLERDSSRPNVVKTTGLAE